MIWVVRAGKKSQYYKKFIDEQRVYLAWEGYNFDLSNVTSLSEFRNIVQKEKNTNNRTSISNWASQLYAFVCEMNEGDFALVPAYGSRMYSLVQIMGNYEYKCDKELCHTRRIKIIKENISREIFDQETRYSLGAFRTVFKVREANKIIEAVKSNE